MTAAAKAACAAWSEDAMPYRNDRDARDARREARALREKRTTKPAAFSLRPSRASVTAMAVGALSLLVMGAALVRPAAPTEATSPAPIASSSSATQNSSTEIRSAEPAVGSVGALGALGGLAASSESGGAPGLAGLAALRASGLRTGVRRVRAQTDTLFHVAPGTECELELRTDGADCAAEVRCGERTIYASDEAHGLTCIRGLGIVSAIFDRATTPDDGSPAFALSATEVQIVDNAPDARGITRLVFDAPRPSVL